LQKAGKIKESILTNCREKTYNNLVKTTKHGSRRGKPLFSAELPIYAPHVPNGSVPFWEIGFFGKGEERMKIGLPELIIVFIVALFVIGPDKLPHYAQKLGVALREFRKVSQDLTKDLKENVIDPLDEAQKPIREAMEPLEELDKEVRGSIKDVEQSVRNIGKPKAKKAEPEQEEQAAPPLEPTAEPLVTEPAEAVEAVEPTEPQEEAQTQEDTTSSVETAGGKQV
jgi:sec-independent protein translocase protein TatB